MKEHGFYIISDKFFEDFPDPYLKGNKKEQRPHYYAYHDERSDLFWMVPMSSQVSKYQRVIDRIERSGKLCTILHIAKLDNDRISVFDIQDIFPITEDYVLREYTIAGNHLRVTSEALAALLDRKVRRTIGMIRRGVKFNRTQPDVLEIEKALLSKNNK